MAPPLAPRLFHQVVGRARRWARSYVTPTLSFTPTLSCGVSHDGGLRLLHFGGLQEDEPARIAATINATYVAREHVNTPPKDEQYLPTGFVCHVAGSTQLVRAFDAAVGVSPMAYLRSLRVKQMAELLSRHW